MDYQATEKFRLNAGITYNKAESSWNWTFSERDEMSPEIAPDAVLADSSSSYGGYAAVNYDNYELNNEIDSYSDLSYEQYQITVGGKYDFTEMLYANASFTYDIFDAGEEYVYGDEDGTAYYGYVGIGWRF